MLKGNQKGIGRDSDAESVSNLSYLLLYTMRSKLLWNNFCNRTKAQFLKVVEALGTVYIIRIRSEYYSWSWLIPITFLVLRHTGIFAQNSFQIDSMNSCSISKQLLFWLKIVKIIHFLTLKPIKGTLGFILEMLKKIARWRHKSEISKRNVKILTSPLLFHL